MIPRTKPAAVVILVSIAALFATAGAAQAKAPTADAARWATLRIVDSGGGSEMVSRARMRERFLRTFDQADLDGNGISRADYELGQRMRAAQQRAQLLAAILRDDLDGDGQVSREELARVHAKDSRRPLVAGGVKVDPTLAQAAQVLDEMVARGMKADTDGDGIIAWSEMRDHANAQSTPLSSTLAGHEIIPLRLDSDGDGIVSRHELVVLADFAFDAADANRDGLLSKDERAALRAAAPALRREELVAERARREALHAQAAAARCALPKLSLAGKVAFVATHRGEALSTVALGGDEQVVTVSRVVVERGSGSLVLVLTSQVPNIWLIEGAVSRVANVIVGASLGDTANVPRAGVVGVPPRKVTIARSTDCLRYAGSFHKAQPEREAARIAAELGRRPDLVFVDHAIASLRLPSGAFDKAATLPGAIAVRRDGPAGAIWSSMETHYPKGLIEFDSSRVVAATKAARYAVLPQEAGLAQLVERGALEIADDAHGVPKRYTIKRQITFPAGLNGAHAVTFVLPNGVPAPRGAPGHSRIVHAQSASFNGR